MLLESQSTPPQCHEYTPPSKLLLSISLSTTISQPPPSPFIEPTHLEPFSSFVFFDPCSLDCPKTLMTRYNFWTRSNLPVDIICNLIIPMKVQKLQLQLASEFLVSNMRGAEEAELTRCNSYFSTIRVFLFSKSQPSHYYPGCPPKECYYPHLVQQPKICH